MSTSNIILHSERLELSFGGIKALDSMSVEVEKGQILSLIGPNGAGKTCFINCVTGYYRPREGQIVFDGTDILGMRPHRIARLGISRTFQNPNTYPTMTALDILLAARYMHCRAGMMECLAPFGRSRREELQSRRSIEEVITFTHIEELRKKPISMMSYGQRKQVEIARALVMQPRLVLLDEPMSGLDDVMKEMVCELILDMHRQGMTIVLVEHDIQTVMELSHKVAVLDHGQKVAEGTPAEISRDARVASAYLGRNEADGQQAACP
ncbi:MAG: ABC transporter ATP-binding protein [Chloroflexi bacterium]|nr:ABC transporter ATP-binding protein [Chloroflexota bacterium]